MESEYTVRRFFVAMFYEQLAIDNPKLAGTFAADSPMVKLHNEDNDPSVAHAPQSYIDKVFPAFNIAFGMELTERSYDTLSEDKKKLYDDSWASIYPYLPNFVRADLDSNKYKEGRWDLIVPEELVDGITAVAQRQAENKRKRQ